MKIYVLGRLEGDLKNLNASDIGDFGKFLKHIEVLVDESCSRLELYIKMRWIILCYGMGHQGNFDRKDFSHRNIFKNWVISNKCSKIF